MQLSAQSSISEEAAPPVAQRFFKSGAENLQGGNIAQPLGSLHHSGLSPQEKIGLLYVHPEAVFQQMFQHLPTVSLVESLALPSHHAG